MNIYLASPFFNEVELNNYMDVLKILRKKGLNVYAPFENELKKDGLTKKEWANKTFIKDVTEIQNADVVVMIFYGIYSDSGTSFECGYAYGIGKPVIALHLHSGKSNCMINCSCHANLSNLKELEDYDFNKLTKIDWYNKDIVG